MTTPTTVWTLSGTLHRPLTCSIGPYRGLWCITVEFERETVLQEVYPAEEHALARAASLRERMMENGWEPAASAPHLIESGQGEGT